MSKKFYCLILAFVMLLAVSAVSAADDMNNASLTADDSTETIAVDEIADDLAADSADDSDNLAADEKLNPNLDVNTTVDDFGNIGINITTEKNATGTVTINITNSSGLVMNDTRILINGSYYLGDFRLLKGEYLISVFYQGDANYTNATANPQLLIEKSVTTLDVETFVDKYGMLKIIAHLNTNATGNVTFNIVRKGDTPDPKNATSIEIINGNATFDEIYALEKGEYEIYVNYNGDKNYYATYMKLDNVTSKKEFLKPNTTLINVTGGEVNVTVDLGALAQGNVTVVYPTGHRENVTIENGKVNIYAVFQKEQGNLSFVLDYGGDDNYYGFYEYYVDFFIKYDSNLTVKSEVNKYGQIVIDASVNKTATGNLTFIIYNSTGGVVANVTKAIENGAASYDELTPFAKDNYTFEVIFTSKDGLFENTTYSIGEANVTKEVPDLDVYSISVNNYGQIKVLTNVTKAANGTVTYTITGDNVNITVNVPVVNGTANFEEINQFDKGQYEIFVEYNGDENYYSTFSINGTSLSKNQINATEDVKVAGNQATITINLANATGNVTVYFLNNGTNQTYNITNGIVKINEIFGNGNQSILVTYDGDANYYGFYEYYIDFFIKYDSNLTVNSEVNKYGQIVINASVNKTATGTITFVIKDANDKVVANVTKAIENGAASYNELTTFAKGKYTFEVIFTSGDDIFENATYSIGEANVTKDQVNVTEDVKVAGNQAAITINLGSATGKVTVYFLNYGTNQTYNITNGIVKINEIFGNGNQSILVTYDGDANYYGFYEYYINFYVKASSFISANPVTVVYQNNGVVTVTLTDNNDNGTGKNPVAGVNVTVTLNGKQYFGVTDAKGIATIYIPANLVPKTYTATVSYAGNSTCNGDNNTFKFTVTKATPKITAKKKTFKAKKKVKKYSVVLKAGKNPVKNVKVTLKIKGKKAFTAKTNAKGKATFKITKLTKKGKYKAVIKSKANSYYKAAAKKKVKITIK